MMTPRQSFEAIADLLERAQEPSLYPIEVRSLIIQAQTHAILQVASHKSAEYRAAAESDAAAADDLSFIAKGAP